MAGLKSIAFVFGGLLFVLVLLLRAGNAYYDRRDRPTVPRDIPEATEADYQAGSSSSYDYDRRDERRRERARRREGVTIEPGSTRPMVDVDANR